MPLVEVGVAEWLRHLVVAQKTMGSNPIAHPNDKRNLLMQTQRARSDQEVSLFLGPKGRSRISRERR